MSYYLKIHNWSGNNLDDAIPRFAKVFRMRRDQAAPILRILVERSQTWQFERTISDAQGDAARDYLERLGFKVELIPAAHPKTETARRLPVENLAPPLGTPAKKSLLGFLKKFKIGVPAQPEAGDGGLGSDGEQAASGAVATEISRSGARRAPADRGPVEEAPARKPLFGFWKKRKKDAEDEEDTAEESALSAEQVSSLMESAPVSAAPAKTAGASRLLWVLLLIILGAGAAAPYWFGMQAEGTIKEFIQRPPPDLIVQLKSYDRGWLRSTAEYAIRFPGLPLSPSLDGAAEIVHGPVALDEWFAGNFGGDYFQARVVSTAKLNLDLLGLKIGNFPQVQGATTLPLSGDWESRISVGPFKTPAGQSPAINWQGLEGNLTFPPDVREARGEIGFKPTTIQTGDGKFTLSKIDVNFNSREGGPAGLILGDFSAGADIVKYENAGNQATLRQIKFSSSSKAVPENNVNFLFDLHAGEIKAGNAVYGPGVLKIAVRNIDAATLQKMRKLKQQKPKPGDANAEMEQRQKTMELFGELTKKVPEFEIVQLNLKTARGEFGGRLKAAVDGRFADLSKSPLLALTALDLELNFDFPELFLRELVSDNIAKLPPQMRAKQGGVTEKPAKPGDLIETLVKEGYLRKEGESYKIDLSFKKGEVVLNGRPMEQFLPIPPTTPAPATPNP